MEEEKDRYNEKYHKTKDEKNSLIQDFNTKKQEFEEEKKKLENENNNLQLLLTSNPETRPYAVENAMNLVKEKFEFLGNFLSLDREKDENETEILLKEKEEEIQLLEKENQRLKNDLEIAKELAKGEFEIEFADCQIAARFRSCARFRCLCQSVSANR